MKFMVVWSIAPENIKATSKRFKEANPKLEAGSKLLGRWHEVGSGKGFSLIETNDLVELSRFTIAWADLVDHKIVPVIEDEEMAKALSG